MRLLIVNAYDERDMYAEAFRSHGFEVKTASSAAEGLAAVARQKPHAIIVGAVLPDLSGVELVARLKASLKATPIVLLTGFCDPQSVVTFRASGADAIVLKPCLPDDLLACVRGLLLPATPARPARAARGSSAKRGATSGQRRGKRGPSAA